MTFQRLLQTTRAYFLFNDLRGTFDLMKSIRPTDGRSGVDYGTGTDPNVRQDGLDTEIRQWLA